MRSRSGQQSGQAIVLVALAMVAMDDWPVNDLYHLVRQAYPYRDLTPTAFDAEPVEAQRAFVIFVALISKKDVGAVFDAMTAEIGKALGKKGPGAFQIPGLCKIILVRKPAQPAKKGVPNPFKPGELMDVAAKPAKNVVKVRPLKNLKGMV